MVYYVFDLVFSTLSSEPYRRERKVVQGAENVVDAFGKVSQEGNGALREICLVDIYNVEKKNGKTNRT